MTKFTSALFSGSARAAVPAHSTPPVPAPNARGPSSISTRGRPFADIERPAARHGAYAAPGADPSFPPMPAKSILPDATLPFSKFSNPMLNERTLVRDAIIGGVTGVLLFFAWFTLLFVDLH